MGKTSSASCLCMVLSMLLMVCSHATKLVPALYIFGDSIYDNGNNNYLVTKAKANYFPYGIDHPLGTTGRFTNGRIITDFYAEWLGLSYQPAYLEVKANPGADKTHEGFNYASAAAGFLKNTGDLAGDTLCMAEQVELFKETVQRHLPKFFTSQKELARHLAKSIFIVDIGINDIHLTFLKQQNPFSHLNPSQFNNLLLQELKKSLKVV